MGDFYGKRALVHMGVRGVLFLPCDFGKPVPYSVVSVLLEPQIHLAWVFGAEFDLGF